jgi:hypothetical protein
MSRKAELTEGLTDGQITQLRWYTGWRRNAVLGSAGDVIHCRSRLLPVGRDRISLVQILPRSLLALPAQARLPAWPLLVSLESSSRAVASSLHLLAAHFAG